ncbi:hypothetical protein KIN20_013235 [Parelaphostrongylus tenuis]|uniref:Uncharacterized protein n=1 Tax=Parelaphostrongylus tenuis TaxID=148309 RepID=A0AAD5MX60_PARTN|nr:hypothetical protein KIN20_013235 [Parelaphostrongylus tenuis]
MPVDQLHYENAMDHIVGNCEKNKCRRLLGKSYNISPRKTLLKKQKFYSSYNFVRQFKLASNNLLRTAPFSAGVRFERLRREAAGARSNARANRYFSLVKHTWRAVYKPILAPLSVKGYTRLVYKMETELLVCLTDGSLGSTHQENNAS